MFGNRARLPRPRCLLDEGLATAAFHAHWGKVSGTHLEQLAEAADLGAVALDGAAVAVAGAKVAAIVQLGILATEIIAAQAAAPFTLGLSELGPSAPPKPRA